MGERIRALTAARQRPADPAAVRFGEALRLTRERAGLNQRQLAHRSGVAQSTISRLERGAMPYARLVVIASVLTVLSCDSDRPFGAGTARCLLQAMR